MFFSTKAMHRWTGSAFGPGSPAASAAEDYVNYSEGFTNETFTTKRVRDLRARGPGKLGQLEVTADVYTEDVLLAGRRLLSLVTHRYESSSYPGCAERAEFLNFGMDHANLTARALRAMEGSANAVACYGGKTACPVSEFLPEATGLLRCVVVLGPWERLTCSLSLRARVLGLNPGMTSRDKQSLQRPIG